MALNSKQAKDIAAAHEVAAKAAAKTAAAAKESAAAAKDELAYKEKSLRASLSSRGITKEEYLDSQKIAREREANWGKFQSAMEEEKKKKQELYDVGFSIRDVSADLLKLTEGMRAPFASVLGLSQEILETRQKDTEMDLALLNSAEKRAEANDEEIKTAENRLAVNGALGNLEKDIMTQVGTGQLSAMSKEEILQKLRNDGLDTTKLTVEEMEALDERIGNISAGTEKLSDQDMQDLMSKAGMMDDTLKGWSDKTKLWGTALKNPAVAMKMIQASGIAMAVTLAKDLFGGALKFKQELGLGAGEAAKLAVNVKAAEMHTKLMGGDASLIAASASEMVKQFGDTSVFTMAIGQDMAGLAVSTGFGGANAAKLLKTMEGISGASIETNINTLESWGNLAGAAGVSKKLVLDDIASSTKEFAEFAKDGGDNIAKAAIHAAELGLNLGTVASIADSLLQFETSIQKEMEAEMLIGKQLNLDRARQLALEGDLDGLMGEVTDNLVSQAEWAEMNVIQRRALADAIGVSAADMGKMIAGEKTSAQVAQDKQEAESSHMDIQKAFMGFQAAMLMAQIGMQMKSFALSKAVAASEAKGAVAGIFKSFSSIPFGIGIALALGAVASMMGLFGKAKGMAEGGVVGEDGGVVAPSDTVPTMLTPGELILNAAQQRNLAGEINTIENPPVAGGIIPPETINQPVAEGIIPPVAEGIIPPVAGGMSGSTTDMKDTNKLLLDTKEQNNQVISELKQARVQHAALMGTLKSAIDRIPMA